MAPLRTPLQGLCNVIRFNWHFYVIAGSVALVLGVISLTVPTVVRTYALTALGLLLAPVAVSLIITAYIYDISTLYQLTWLPPGSLACPAILTINAGFDEISPLVQQRYAAGSLQVVDFYDPARHTEVSIKRARRAYPPFPGTLAVSTREALPLPTNSIDLAFAFLAAHEIRNADERAAFFQEIQRVLKPNGQIVVTEHLRDPANFLAYTIGFFHFHSRRAWLTTFRRADLQVEQEISITPFVTAFILRK